MSVFINEFHLLVQHVIYDLPIFALQRSAPGRWVLWAPDENPFTPAVHAVAVLEDMTMRPTAPTRTRAEWGNVDWHEDLLQLARLVDRLSPDRDDPEAFFVKKNALAHELRRLAHWARHAR
jgi:hypothetical protein